MRAAYDDGFARMYVSDAVSGLAALPEKSVHTCVTSPPYFGLRSYLPADHPDKAKEGGTQQTPEAYVEWLVEVFRGVWRVLRDDGTAWINLGDSYNAYNGNRGPAAGANKNHHAVMPSLPAGHGLSVKGLKPKDLIGIPWRVAFALQADGWTLRSDIIWNKPNPMPESVTDRPTKSHEYLFLLTKSPRYFFDAEAVKEKGRDWGPRDRSAAKHNTDGFRAAGQPPHKGLTNGDASSGRNLRSVWTISTRPYAGAHFATFPPALVGPCIKAGTSERGVCAECRAPWQRVVEHKPSTEARKNHAGNHASKGGASRIGGFYDADSRTVGWEPTCSHSSDVVPATVLDPFSGSGTTLLTARKLGRRSLGIDLDERNLSLLEERMGYQGVML